MLYIKKELIILTVAREILTPNDDRVVLLSSISSQDNESSDLTSTISSFIFQPDNSCGLFVYLFGCCCYCYCVTSSACSIDTTRKMKTQQVYKKADLKEKNALTLIHTHNNNKKMNDKKTHSKQVVFYFSKLQIHFVHTSFSAYDLRIFALFNDPFTLC